MRRNPDDLSAVPPDDELPCDDVDKDGTDARFDLGFHDFAFDEDDIVPYFGVSSGPWISRFVGAGPSVVDGRFKHRFV